VRNYVDTGHRNRDRRPSGVAEPLIAKSVGTTKLTRTLDSGVGPLGKLDSWLELYLAHQKTSLSIPNEKCSGFHVLNCPTIIVLMPSPGKCAKPQNRSLMRGVPRRTRARRDSQALLNAFRRLPSSNTYRECCRLEL